MSKFKVGDKVRVKKEEAVCFFQPWRSRFEQGRCAQSLSHQWVTRNSVQGVRLYLSITCAGSVQLLRPALTPLITTEREMSKEWTITKSIVGTAWCTVEAETEEDARRIARESGEWEINEWEITTPCAGNVCHLRGIYGADDAVCEG